MSVYNIQFKSSVRVQLLALDPEMTDALRVAALVAPPLYQDTLVVTSQNDSEHKIGSLHPLGRAWDIRFLGYQIGGIATGDQHNKAEEWASRIRQVLGADWDILKENDHIHMELDLS